MRFAQMIVVTSSDSRACVHNPGACRGRCRRPETPPPSGRGRQSPRRLRTAAPDRWHPRSTSATCGAPRTPVRDTAARKTWRPHRLPPRLREASPQPRLPVYSHRADPTASPVDRSSRGSLAIDAVKKSRDLLGKVWEALDAWCRRAALHASGKRLDDETATICRGVARRRPRLRVTFRGRAALVSSISARVRLPARFADRPG